MVLFLDATITPDQLERTTKSSDVSNEQMDRLAEEHKINVPKSWTKARKYAVLKQALCQAWRHGSATLVDDGAKAACDNTDSPTPMWHPRAELSPSAFVHDQVIPNNTTIRDLRAFASQQGIALPKSMRKAALLARIRAEMLAQNQAHLHAPLSANQMPPIQSLLQHLPPAPPAGIVFPQQPLARQQPPFEDLVRELPEAPDLPAGAVLPQEPMPLAELVAQDQPRQPEVERYQERSGPIGGEIVQQQAPPQGERERERELQAPAAQQVPLEEEEILNLPLPPSEAPSLSQLEQAILADNCDNLSLRHDRLEEMTGWLQTADFEKFDQASPEEWCAYIKATKGEILQQVQTILGIVDPVEKRERLKELLRQVSTDMRMAQKSPPRR